MPQHRKCTDEQIEEMRDMKLNQGKTYAEIALYFAQKYNIALNDTNIAYYCKPVDLHERDKSKKTYPQKKRKYTKKSKPVVGGGTSKDEIKQLIDDLFAECEAYNQYVIKKIRMELIRRRAEVRQKRIEVGENVEAIDESEA